MGAADVIDFDVDCFGCGYNLRGLSAGAACPECGLRILSSIDEHIRRRSASRVDQVRFRDRSLTSLRAIRSAASYGLAANLIGFSWLFIPVWMMARRSTPRVVLLCALCCAMSFAALSIWKIGTAIGRRPNKIGISRLLLWIGGTAAILLPMHETFVRDNINFQGYQRVIGYDAARLIIVLLSGLIGAGVVLRVAFIQWWLRLEGISYVAWPFLLCVLPLAIFHVMKMLLPRFSLSGGSFVSIEYFTETPLTSNSWPAALYYLPNYIRYRSAEDTFLAVALLLGHVIVLSGDFTLGLLARRALRNKAKVAEVTQAIQLSELPAPNSPT